MNLPVHQIERAMKVRLNIDVCQGHGLCADIAPEIFTINEDTGLAELIKDSVDEGSRSEVVEAVNSCPVQAIALEES